jgi:hypothetical protein
MLAVVANFPWESPVLRGASASFGLLRPVFLLGQPLPLQRLLYGDAAGAQRSCSTGIRPESFRPFWTISGILKRCFAPEFAGNIPFHSAV